jgi:hypothetical protein
VTVGATDVDAGVLTVERGVSIRGVVLDPDGEPAAGAFVRARGASDEVIAALDGRFVLEGLRDARHTVVARQPGYPEASVSDVAPGSDVRIQLRPGGLLAGRVVRPGNQPLTAFTLALLYSELPGASAERVGQQDGAIMREYPFDSPEGSFELRGISPDTYDLVVTAVGEPGTAGRLGRLTVAAGEQKRGLRLIVGSGATLTGRVVDEETGAPLASARVTLDTPGKSPSTLSDPTGAFTLRGVLVGQRLRIDIHAAGHAPHVLYVRIPEGAKEHDAGAVRLPR